MSFSDVPPVGPGDALLGTMRKGCRAARLASGIVLDQVSIDRFILDVLPAAPTDADLASWLASGFRLPLLYPTLHAEVNVLCNLCMLNSLSGYRVAFHRALGQGAHKTIVQIVMGLYLADPTASGGDAASGPLSASALAALTPMQLLELLRLPTHDESAHPSIPAAVVGARRRDDVYEALETLCIAANDTGNRLVSMKCPDLGVFVERLLIQSARQGKTDEGRASLFANGLIAALPAFNDSHTFDDGTVVHIHKRALLLLSWMHSAFASRSDGSVGQLPLPSPSVLPAFVDNVIPSLLVHFGILDLSAAKDAGLRQWHVAIQNATPPRQQKSDDIVPGPTLTRTEAYRVRAASIDACHALRQRAAILGKQHDRPWLLTITEALIDGWLWTQAKRVDLSIVPRMVETKTFMY